MKIFLGDFLENNTELLSKSSGAERSYRATDPMIGTGIIPVVRFYQIHPYGDTV